MGHEDYLNPQPSSLEGVLSRFRPDFEQAKKDNHSQLLDYLNKSYRREPFVNKISPKECPNYLLIVAGALLTEIINLEETPYLDKILCGHTEIKVDDLGWMGPLSGRQGTEYRPLSQCWRTAFELEGLINFMKQEKEMLALTSNTNEDEKRKILNERYHIQTRNEQRQTVFVAWSKLRPEVSSLLATNNRYNQLKPPVSTKTSNETDLVEQILDYSAQLNLGGLEYQELTDWVNQQILIPLKNLVGEHYFYYSTARNCHKAPKEDFFGIVS